MSDTWIIEVRTGFAVDGELIDLMDEDGQPIEIDDLLIEMRLMGHGQTTVFTIASGNFTLLPPVLPATVATIWRFSMTTQQVAALKDGKTNAEVIVTDQNNALVGSFVAVIEKR